MEKGLKSAIASCKIQTVEIVTSEEGISRLKVDQKCLIGADVSSPVVGNTERTVKNSCEIADLIRGKTIGAENVLSILFLSSPNFQFTLPLKFQSKDLERTLSENKRFLCFNRQICFPFVLTPHNLYTVAFIITDSWQGYGLYRLTSCQLDLPDLF